MNGLFESTIPKDEQEEIKEFISIILLLSKEDRAVLLSNANAFKVRRDIEKARRNQDASLMYGRFIGGRNCRKQKEK